MERVDLFSASRKQKFEVYMSGSCLLPARDRPQQLALLLSSSASSVVCEPCVGLIFLEFLPRTIRESVPRVREAFLPTASVSGTFMSSPVGSDEGGACEGAALVVSRGSLKGSSAPAIEAMITIVSQKGVTPCRVERKDLESTSRPSTR
jgi:hypothetical protein